MVKLTRREIKGLYPLLACSLPDGPKGCLTQGTGTTSQNLKSCRQEIWARALLEGGMPV